MCFVFIWEQTATCATYSINWLVFITEMKSVYCAVRTGSLNTAVCPSSLMLGQLLSWLHSSSISEPNNFFLRTVSIPSPRYRGYKFAINHGLTLGMMDDRPCSLSCGQDPLSVQDVVPRPGRSAAGFLFQGSKWNYSRRSGIWTVFLVAVVFTPANYHYTSSVYSTIMRVDIPRDAVSTPLEWRNITCEERSLCYVVHTVLFLFVWGDSLGDINTDWRLILDLLLNKHFPNYCTRFCCLVQKPN